MNSTAPITLLQSPKGKKQEDHKFAEKGSAVSVKLLKEADFDLSKLPQPQ
jgi:hypothetical protein